MKMLSELLLKKNCRVKILNFVISDEVARR